MDTKSALHMAYTGEAKAALRLKVYAEKADREGYAQMAKLFRVIAFSESIHGSRALKLLREVKSTEENLAASFAVLHFSQSRDVEEIHAKLYKEAMNHFMEERETTYHVCKVCGYVADGVLPDECPVCSAKKEQFVQFD